MTGSITRALVLKLHHQGYSYRGIQKLLDWNHGIKVSHVTVRTMILRAAAEARVQDAVTILIGDCREHLRALPDRCVQCVVTSPPYFHKRDYQHDAQIGREPTPDAYVAALLHIFRQVKRVLRDDGTAWVNLGATWNNRSRIRTGSHQPTLNGTDEMSWAEAAQQGGKRGSIRDDRWKEKDLILIPAMTALALQQDGWYLRSEIVWVKRGGLPETVNDRPTSAHEMIYLLSKRRTYKFDAQAIAEPAARAGSKPGGKRFTSEYAPDRRHSPSLSNVVGETRRSRDVWYFPTARSTDHPAAMPLGIADRCIRASTGIGDVVLDPFAGSGTTGLAAKLLGRRAVLIDAQETYRPVMERRLDVEYRRLQAKAGKAEKAKAV